MSEGIILLRPLDDDKIAAGSKAVIEYDNGHLIVDVMHLNANGHWSVNSGAVTTDVPEGELKEVFVEDKRPSGFITLPLKHTDWKKVINHVGAKVNYKKVTIPFVPGPYSCLCKACGSYFEGAKKQNLCDECCENTSEAKLSTGIQPSKNKRPRMVTAKEAKARAQAAFNAAKVGVTDFESWYENLIKDGNSTINGGSQDGKEV